MIGLIIAGVIVVFIFAVNALRIVQQYEKGLVEWLGKYSYSVGPGLNFIIPIFQTIAIVYKCVMSSQTAQHNMVGVISTLV